MNVLIVEDEISSARLIERILGQGGNGSFRVLSAASLREALDHLTTGDVDLVLLDLALPDSSGLGTLEAIQAASPSVPVVIVTASENDELAFEAVRRGAQDYIYKGELDPRGLPRLLRHAFERHRLTAEVARRERDLALSQSTFASIVERSADGILVVDHERVVCFVNQTLEKVDGEEARALVGKPLPPHLPLTTGQRIAVELRDRGPRMSEVRTAPSDWGGRPAEVITLRDITRRVEAEEARLALERQLLQAQKMEAVAQLAGGVAHNFNNMLTVVIAHCEDLLEELSPDDPRRPLTEAIIRDAERSAAIASQLTAFGRREIRQPQVCDLREVVGSVEDVLRPLIGEDVAVEVVCSAHPCLVNIDRSQIEQVVMNLAVNARDAMDGGTLTIRVGSDDLREPPPGVPAGRYTTLTVRDTGCGMDEETRARIFEPFFTTKEEGKGTGLGLSTVHGIVHQSGGYISVESAPGKGTTFTIYLPEAKEAPSGAGLLARDGARPGGLETILVVEDDDAVRYLLGRTLKKRGYGVMEAPHGGDALLIAQSYPGTIDLMITDVVMPEISGRELADRMRKLRPAMEVLFVSGHTNDAVLRHGLQSGSADLMVKPFSGAVLAQRVRAALDRHAARSAPGSRA